MGRLGTQLLAFPLAALFYGFSICCASTLYIITIGRGMKTPSRYGPVEPCPGRGGLWPWALPVCPWAAQNRPSRESAGRWPVLGILASGCACWWPGGDAGLTSNAKLQACRQPAHGAGRGVRAGSSTLLPCRSKVWPLHPCEQLSSGGDVWAALRT